MKSESLELIKQASFSKWIRSIDLEACLRLALKSCKEAALEKHYSLVWYILTIIIIIHPHGNFNLGTRMCYICLFLLVIFIP